MNSMPRILKARVILAALLTTLTVFAFPPSVYAHPPENPFDNTIFAPIGPGGFNLALERIVEGFTSPLKGVVAPGHSSRLFIVDQPGILWAVDLNTRTKTVFLDLTERLVPLGFLGPGTFDERGFLGVAFHPDYLNNGLLYTYTSEPVRGRPTFPTTLPPGTNPDHQNVIAEWRVPSPTDQGSVVDPRSRREMIRVDWPQFNHDGGDLAFGPDGMLYISMGDGGGADDQGVGHGPEPNGNAQRLTVPLGKIHRIDPLGSNSRNRQYGIPSDNPFIGRERVLEEIFAFGFRNPYRFSFDRTTGNMFVGDAGQNDIEEVDLVVPGGNHGWPLKEGTLFFYQNGPSPGFASPEDHGLVPADAIDPIAQYDTHHEGHSVIGGFVYRGTAIPELAGRYVCGDFAKLFRFPSGPNNTGRLFYLQQKSSPGERLQTIKEFMIDGGFGLALLGFGQDAAGELYALGNISGVPFGNEGVIVRLAAVS